jgi:hypothetical protein
VEIKSANEILNEISKDKKTSESEFYCWGCKKITTHLVVDGNEYYCKLCVALTMVN